MNTQMRKAGTYLAQGEPTPCRVPFFLTNAPKPVSAGTSPINSSPSPPACQSLALLLFPSPDVSRSISCLWRNHGISFKLGNIPGLSPAEYFTGVRKAKLRASCEGEGTGGERMHRAKGKTLLIKMMMTLVCNP